MSTPCWSSEHVLDIYTLLLSLSSVYYSFNFGHILPLYAVLIIPLMVFIIPYLFHSEIKFLVCYLSVLCLSPPTHRSAIARPRPDWPDCPLLRDTTLLLVSRQLSVQLTNCDLIRPSIPDLFLDRTIWLPQKTPLFDYRRAE